MQQHDGRQGAPGKPLAYVHAAYGGVHPAPVISLQDSERGKREMLSKSNQPHGKSVTGGGPSRHGQFSQWLENRLPHRYGYDPSGFDADFTMQVAKKASHFFGPGKYFELSLRGLEQLPREPVMLVSNHSGGTSIPDVWGFGVAWYRHFGPKRPLYMLCHELLFALPVFARFFEKVGALRASHEVARKVIAQGHDLLIFPGGDLDTWRPYSERYRVDFAGRCGFARLALESKMPIVPVAHSGAHETLRVLTSGRAFAKAVGLRKIARAEVWPIHLSLPWGLALGPLPHIPLPGKFRYVVGGAMAPGPTETAEHLASEVQNAVQRQLNLLRDEELPGSRGAQNPFAAPDLGMAA
jgi:1-acyl-sn-glycerol-3-phosphate acyltransferase